jgi:hypothetical protein
MELTTYTACSLCFYHNLFYTLVYNKIMLKVLKNSNFYKFTLICINSRYTQCNSKTITRNKQWRPRVQVTKRFNIGNETLMMVNRTKTCFPKYVTTVIKSTQLKDNRKISKLLQNEPFNHAATLKWISDRNINTLKPAVTICTTYFNNQQLLIFHINCIYGFHYFPQQQ